MKVQPLFVASGYGSSAQVPAVSPIPLKAWARRRTDREGPLHGAVALATAVAVFLSGTYAVTSISGDTPLTWLEMPALMLLVAVAVTVAGVGLLCVVALLQRRRFNGPSVDHRASN